MMVVAWILHHSDRTGGIIHHIVAHAFHYDPVKRKDKKKKLREKSIDSSITHMLFWRALKF